MNPNKLMISVTVAMFVLLTPAFAQQYAVRATIPFDFTVGQQSLPAGEYRVSINGPAMLRIAQIGGTNLASLTAEPIGGVENVSPRLIFHRYNKQYFLAQVWVGELNLGHQLYASAAELNTSRMTKQETAMIVAKQFPAK